MDQKEFLTRVLPAGNHYIAYPSDKTGSDGKTIWHHKTFTSPDEGVRVALRLRTRDIYFAVASYKQPKIKDPKTGYMKSFRKQQNVDQLKALYLDVDFKNYESPEDAVADVTRFIQESKIERPTIIVESGGGMHLYWTFDKPIPLSVWQPLAQGLAGLAENLGLKADLQCTIDSARILRLPDTVNHKYDPPRQCVVRASRDDVDFDKLASQLHGVTSLGARGRPRRSLKLDVKVDPAVVGAFSQTNTDLQEGVETGRPRSMKQITSEGGCPLMADILTRGGNGDSRDLWNNMLLLASFTTDGREYAHTMSQGDQRYSAGEVDADMDAKAEEIAARGLGPTTCDTFSRHSNICKTCPHFGKIVSPIVLGVEPEVPFYTTILKHVAPHPGDQQGPTFTRDGNTFCRLQDEHGNFVPVISGELTPLAIQLRDDPGEANLTSLLCELKSIRTGLITIDLSKLTSREYLPRILNGRGCHIYNLKLLGNLLVAWSQLLANKHAAGETFGWTADGFVCAGRLFASDGSTRPYSVVSPSVERNYAAKGDIRVWQALARLMIADSRPQAQLIVAAPFAGPLMYFVNPSVATLAIRSSRSGHGKTTLLQIARGAFGHPKDISNALDTEAARQAKLFETQYMTSYTDDLQLRDDQAFRDNLFQMSQGRSKGRANVDGSARATFAINGLHVISTNEFLRSVLDDDSRGTDAGLYRILEVELPPAPRDVDMGGMIDKLMMRLINTDHGEPGQVYLRYLAAHQDEAAALVAAERDWFNKHADIGPEERYWLCACTAIMAGAVLASDAGVVAFNLDRLRTTLCDVVKSNRPSADAIQQLSGYELAAQIYNTFSDNRLVTDYLDLYDMGRPRLATPRNLSPQLRLPIRVRASEVENKVVISRSAINEFAHRHTRLRAGGLIGQLKEAMCQPPIKLNLTKGINSNTLPAQARELSYVFDAEAIGVTLVASRPDASPGSSSATAPGDSPPS